MNRFRALVASAVTSPKSLMVATLVALALLGAGAPVVASAAAPTPRWQLQSVPKPMNFTTGAFFTETANVYEIVLTDIGGAPTVGPVTISGHVAPGLSVLGANGGSGNIFTCTETNGGVDFSCTAAALEPGDSALELSVDVAANAPEVLETEITVSGGGAPAVTRVFTNFHTESEPNFGIDEWSVFPSGPAGEDDNTAGGRPTLFNTYLTTPVEDFFYPGAQAPYQAQRGGAENVKDLVVDLPPGFVGNPTTAPKCSIQVFLSEPAPPNGCPAGSRVGTFALGGSAGVYQAQPIYNLAPEHGYPAEFGFYDSGLSHGIVAQATLAHTSNGYVVRFDASELVKVLAGPYYLQVSFFGNPERETGILGGGKPFFTNPADCSGKPLQTTLHLDTWANPAPTVLNADGGRDYEKANFSEPQWHNVVSESAPVVGCEALQFNPTLDLSTEESKADSPTGLNIDVSVPQNEEPDGLATPPLRDATVQLPAGLVVDPSSADGLVGCTESELAPDSTDPGGCPEASKLGTASLRTPLIAHQLAGSVYLGAPECAPCSDADAAAGRLLKLYIEIDDPATGVVIKLPGAVVADPATGRLTASFKENPQLPFEDLRLHIDGGPRAPLTTPSLCGRYTTTTDLMPWSAPQSGPDAMPQSTFSLSSGPGGSACPFAEAELANGPSLQAGATASLAGAYSPFVLKLSREDGSQRFAALNVTLPEGLTGKLAGVAQCSDAQIAAAAGRSGSAESAGPSCPASSELGTVTIGAGSGAPLYVGGHVYLAGPYRGAPFSLAIITPAVAGPFDLGDVVVRSALFINPATTRVTVKSDPLPTMLAGVPLDIRSIAVSISRPGFTLNPTSCEATSLTGEEISTLGQTVAMSNRFQVGGCTGLAFKPVLSASTQGKTSRADGASLRLKITSAGIGQANIGKLDLTIPSVLPARLTTLQKACSEAQFSSNPAGCPKESLIATATVHTPLLNSPLTGPVYFVSHGGAAFPDTEIVLQGEGVTLVLDGHTQITKGVTYSRFESVPDAPFTSFEFNAPEGPYSIFGANVNLCQAEVRMPAKIVAQDGAVITQSTLVEPEGCPDKLTIVSHKVSKRTLTLKVAVPGAGKLTLTGNGLAKKVTSASGRKTLTLTMKANGRGRLQSRIKLSFSPLKGKKLRASIPAKFSAQ